MILLFMMWMRWDVGRCRAADPGELRGEGTRRHPSWDASSSSVPGHLNSRCVEPFGGMRSGFRVRHGRLFTLARARNETLAPWNQVAQTHDRHACVPRRL